MHPIIHGTIAYRAPTDTENVVDVNEVFWLYAAFDLLEDS